MFKSIYMFQVLATDTSNDETATATLEVTKRSGRYKKNKKNTYLGFLIGLL